MQFAIVSEVDQQAIAGRQPAGIYNCRKRVQDVLYCDHCIEDPTSNLLLVFDGDQFFSEFGLFDGKVYQISFHYVFRSHPTCAQLQISLD